MWDTIKTMIVTIVSACLAFCEPINNVILILFIMAGIDLFVGRFASKFIEREPFRFRKFINAILYLIIYLSITILIYVIGALQGDHGGAQLLVKTVTYIFIYFYGANILKNFKKIAPQSRAIAFLAYMFDFEFAKKIPALARFLAKEGHPDCEDLLKVEVVEIDYNKRNE